jgi:hypothetical protein
MQNPRITKFESKYEERIKKVAAFNNLVNVVVFSLEEFEKHIGLSDIIFERKTASTAQFVSFALFEDLGYVVSTEELPVQVADSPKPIPAPATGTAH